MLLGAGAVGAAGMLAGCTDDGSSGPQQPVSETSGATSGEEISPEDTAAAIPVAHIPVGGGFIDFDRGVVVTQPEAGQFRAFDANCTHERCLLTWVEAGLINCPCHGSQFRIADGSVARGPATESLHTRSATVDGGAIVVR
jgi:Rieske Fe-S protein